MKPTNKKSYAERKEAARNEAMEWQEYLSDHCPSYGELAESMAHFENLGKRYGLIQEFRENAII